MLFSRFLSGFFAAFGRFGRSMLVLFSVALVFLAVAVVRTVTRSPTISFDDETRSPNSSARSPSRFHLSLCGEG